MKDGACYSWFECKNGVERVEITLDVHLSTNSVNVSAEVFPRKESCARTGADMVTTVNYHKYAKQSSAELIAEGAIS